MSAAAAPTAAEHGKQMKLKDGKGTLTNLFKKKGDAAAASNDVVEVIDLVDDATEALPTTVDEVTPLAPQNQDAEKSEEQNDLEMMEEVPLVAEQSAAAMEASDDQKEKKRKRTSKTPEQLAALESLFSANAYPSTNEKRECGAKIDLDLNAVNNWFEGRRRKVSRASGSGGAGTSKRGRPAETAAGVVVVTEEHEEEAPADVDMVDAPTPPAAIAVSPPPVAAAAVTSPPSASPAKASKSTKSTAAATPALPEKGQRLTLLTELAQEATVLRERGLAAPLRNIIPVVDADVVVQMPFSDALLATYIVGQQLPLSELVSALFPMFAAPEGVAALTVEALRSHIVDLAVRKSHDPVDNPKGAPPRLDALEAVPETAKPSMWQWELRDAKFLAKDLRTAAAAIKKRAGRVGERLTAVVHAHDALLKHEAGSMTANKTAKALEALNKHSTLDELEAGDAAEREAAAAKEAAKLDQATQTADDKKRAAAEREAEKERIKQEKAEERERLHKEKEEAKERKHKEAEAAKLVKKTGFKDKNALNKSASILKNFFKSAGAPSSAAKPISAAGSPLGGMAPTPLSHTAAPPGSTPTTATASNNTLTAYQRRFPKPPLDNLVPQPLQPLCNDTMDAALAAPPPAMEDTYQDWKAGLARLAAARKTATTAPPSHIGLPPSWARLPGAIEAASERLRHFVDSGVDPAAVKCWRRKFIWFQGDLSKRPPYYGSWRRPGSRDVGPRRYLGKDETLEYEVMSDLEWEEEPEGSSLSGADEEDDGPVVGEESEVEDSFMVADGYLSEDEGVRLDDEMDFGGGGGGEVVQSVSHGGGGDFVDGGDGDGNRHRAALVMHKLLDRARRSMKPLVVVRSDIADAVGVDSSSGACVLGDASALEALAMEVLLPGVSFMPAQDPDVVAKAAGVTAGGGGGSGGKGGEKTDGGGGSGRLKIDRPDDLIPALAAFIQEHAIMAKPKLIEGFVEAHSDRKMSKKWVGEKISALAERSAGKWKLRFAAPPLGVSGTEVEAEDTFIHEKTPGGGGGGGGGAASAKSGPLDRLLINNNNNKAPNTAQKLATPSVPSALRPQAPPSNMKAPDRLVTTMGTTTTIRIPEAVEGTSDDFWMELLQAIEAGDGGSSSSSSSGDFAVAFQPEVLSRFIHALPAFILDSLLTAAATTAFSSSTEETKKKAATAVCCLRATVEALAIVERPSNPENEATFSQKAWGDARSGSHTASLAGLCREPALPAVLRHSIAGDLGAEAAVDGVKMVLLLVGCPALKEMKAEDAGSVRESLKKSGGAALNAWNSVFTPPHSTTTTTVAALI